MKNRVQASCYIGAPGSATQVLLVHPGGPFWAKKDSSSWSIPKGELPWVYVPHWVVATAGALRPLLWLAAVTPKRLRLRRRKRLGLCLECGYDLRESPERCPECGNVPGNAN